MRGREGLGRRIRPAASRGGHGNGPRAAPGAAAYDDAVTSGARTAAPLRRVRGLVVGLVGGAVAVTGHVVAGGAALSPAVVAALALVVCGAVVASRQRWTPGRLLVALAAAQPAVHGVLWLTSPTGSSHPRLAVAGTGTGTGAHGAHAAGGLDARMLVAHAAAVVVAALVLLALEACALSLWSLLHAVRIATNAVVVPVAARIVMAARPGAVAADGLVVVGRRPRRGPPAVPAPC